MSIFNDKEMNPAYIYSENNRLKLQISQLEDQLSNYKNQTSETIEKYSILQKYAKDFCLFIVADKYAIEKIGGITHNNKKISDFTIEELLQYAKHEYITKQAEMRKLSNELALSISDKNNEIEHLKDQISIYENEGLNPANRNLFSSSLKDSNLSSPSVPTQPVAKPIDEPMIATIEEFETAKIEKFSSSVMIEEEYIPSVSINNNNSKETEQSKKRNTKDPIDTASLIEQFKAKERMQKEIKVTGNMQSIDISYMVTEYEKDELIMSIFRIIGELGLSKKTDIEKKMLSMMEKASVSTIHHTLSKLNTALILDVTKISIGTRGFHVYVFTELGKRIFLNLFLRKPVETEAEKLIRENASIEHGYMILEVQKILLDVWKYEYAEIDRDKNVIKKDNNKYYIPDVIASKDGKYKEFFEVERNTHTHETFSDKCEKMKSTTKTFNFICQNKSIIEDLSKKTNRWIESIGRSKLKGYTIRYATFNDLENKNWSKIDSF